MAKYNIEDTLNELTIEERKLLIEYKFTIKEALEVFNILKKMEPKGYWDIPPTELMQNIASAFGSSPAACIHVYYRKIAESFRDKLFESGYDER